MFGPWRAALCAAPTILVLTGSLWLANRSRLEAQKSDVGIDSDATVISVSPADEERMHRVAIKHEAVVDLLDGRMTFDEAMARFWDVAASSPEALSNLRDMSEATDEE